MTQKTLESEKEKEIRQKVNQEAAMSNKTPNSKQKADKILEKNNLVNSYSDEVKAQLLLSRQYLENLYKEVLYNNEDKQKINLEKCLFQGFLSYASNLYSKDKITQDTYISLVEKATESYVENLYELSINRFIDKCEAYLKKSLMG